MEVLLILDIARAQREVARAEHILASCHAREYETIAELYRFKARHRATNFDMKEVDMGLMRAAMNRHGNHTTMSISFPAMKSCMRAPDGTLLRSLIYCTYIIILGTVNIESASLG